MPESSDIQKLQNLITPMQIAMVNTIHLSGKISSRPMGLQECDADGNLWFITDERTAKVEELVENDHVTVTLSDEDRYTFVVVYGHGEVIKDTEKVNDLWIDRMQLWFPEGPDDPHIVLIRVQIVTVEYWDSQGGRTQEVPSEKTTDYDEFQV